MSEVRSNNKMSVQRSLRAKAACGVSPELQTYDAIQAAANQISFDWLVTLTFSHPVTDPIAVENVCRRLKRFINKYFYRRQTPRTKFLFLIEPHAATHNGKKKYHVHFLMTTVKEQFRIKGDFRKWMTLERCSSLRFQIWKHAWKLRTIVPNSKARITRIDVKRIYDQRCLCDYLLKTLKLSSIRELRIDYINSDLSW